MDHIVLSFKFNRRNKLNERGEASIELYIFKNRREYLHRATGISIEPKYWDSEKQLIKKGCPESIQLNSSLDEMKEKHRLFIDEINRRKNGFKMSDFSKFAESKNSRSCFLVYMENEIKRAAKQGLAPSTVKTHNNKLSNLKKFRTTIPFDEISVRLIEDFNSFMKAQNDGKTKHNTLKSHHKVIKTYLNKAIREKLLLPDDLPYGKNKFTMRWHAVGTAYLQPSQILHLENYIPTDSKLERVKDAFLFSCYTGLRQVDYSQLSFENFVIDDTGKITLKYKPQKVMRFGNKEHNIPLYRLFKTPRRKHTKPELIALKYLKIFEEYKDEPNKVLRQFFRISNQKMNEYLKDLFVAAKLKHDKNMKCTTHLGRHTFGTLMCNELNIPITVVKELMGHSDINQTMKYVVVNDRVIGSVLDQVDWKTLSR